MSGKQNIEDLFKNNFDNLNVEPTQKVWEGVNSNLWYSNIQNAFYNYTVQPTSKAWRKIAFRLWFKDFIVFSPLSFNVYYLSAILVVCSTLIFTSYNYSDKDFLFTNSPIEKNTKTNTINNSNTLTEVSIIHNSVNAKVSNPNTTNNEEVIIVKELNKKNQTAVKKEKFNNTNNLINNKVSVHEPIIDNDELFTELHVRDYSGLLKMLHRNPKLIPESFSDSSLKSRLEFDFNNKKWHWSVEGFVTPMFGSSTYKINDSEINSFSKNYGGSKANLTLSGGLLVQAKHLNFSFQTGFSYTRLTDKPDYKYLNTKYFTSIVTEIIPDYDYNYFEIEVLNLDSLLLNGDSVWITIQDSTLITTFDTITKPQVIQKNTIDHKKTINTFSYFEIPLIAGYTISQGKLNFTLRGGIITGILTSVSGNLPSPYSEVGTINVKNKTTRKIMFSGIVGIEAAYDASKNISIIAAPVYRFNLLSLYKKDNIINQRFNNLGIKLGIRYNFK
ncbi:MAG: hypothetical protein HY951_10440 [Bacteroidia bacterium]|nr:hypothetical protein [Bacteroidia bacterium]